MKTIPSILAKLGTATKGTCAKVFLVVNILQWSGWRMFEEEPSKYVLICKTKTIPPILNKLCTVAKDTCAKVLG